MSFKAWFYLNEAVQQIVNLGYPKLIADIFEKKFGRKANAIAKWYKDAHSRGYDEGWWDMHANPFGGYLNMKDLMRMYEALPDPEKYREVMKKLGYEPSPEPRDSDYYNNQKENVYEQIKQKLLGDSFFDDHFIKAIIDGSQQIPPYKGMSLTNAREKYEKKLLFKDATPIRKYSDGMRWIDAGKTCVYLGQRMKNCGRVGAMSIDTDATIFALFDENENPHAMVTYEPHQNRITGIEGPGRTELKSEYDHYVLDLLQSLNADYAY